MSEVSTGHVKHGLWVDVDRDASMGRTITADVRTGTVIIALLAILVTLATSHLWNLFAFVIHQLRAKVPGSRADGFFRQQQALLRASPPPDSFIAEWLKLWWFWRTKVRSSVPRMLTQSIIALVFFAATILAGLFSAYIVDSTDLEVLVASPDCAVLDIPTILSPNEGSSTTAAIEGYMNSVQARSYPYFQACYQNSSSAPSQCNIFIQPRISLSYELADCPFDDSICIDQAYPAVSIDSGLVDANDAFGWNLGLQDRLKYRKKTTCAILKTDGHQSVVNASDYPYLGRAPYPREQILLNHYGNRSSQDAWANVTFAQSLLLSNVSIHILWATAVKHGSAMWDIGEEQSFDPMSELYTTDSDLLLLFVGKALKRYRQPVNDPLFSAHKAFQSAFTDNDNVTMYASDSETSVLGCKFQYQYCFSGHKKTDFCTDLSSLPTLETIANFETASAVQVAGMQLLARASSLWDITEAAMKGWDVDSKVYDLSGAIVSLPDDQWIQEILRFEGFTWATLQTYISDYAIGAGAQYPPLNDFLRKNLTAGERQLCSTQRMRKAGCLVNINVLGLLFVITFATVVTLLDLVMLKFLLFLKRFRRALSPRIEQWIQDGIFQLQYWTYRVSGEGDWERIDKEVPTTITGELLDDLSPKTQSPCCSHVCQAHDPATPCDSVMAPHSDDRASSCCDSTGNAHNTHSHARSLVIHGVQKSESLQSVQDVQATDQSVPADTSPRASSRIGGKGADLSQPDG